MFLGEASQETLESVKSDLTDFCRYLPLHIRVGKDNMFGPKKNIPVKHIEILNEEAKTAFLNFYRKYGKAEPGMPYLDTPSYYVSVKDIAEELPEHSEHYWTEKFFIKQLGPYDPIFTISI